MPWDVMSVDSNAITPRVGGPAAYAPWQPSLNQFVMTSGVFASEQLSRQLDSVRAIGAEDDWDGEGAIGITDTVIGNTKIIAQHLVSAGVGAPDVVPNNNGTVTLEWDRKDGSACLEIGNTQFSFFFRAKNGGKAYAGGPAKDFADSALFVQSLLSSVPFGANSAHGPIVMAFSDAV